MRRKITRPLLGGIPIDPIDSGSGGTGQDTAPEALVAIGAVAAIDVGQAFGPIPLDASGKIDASKVSGGYAPAVQGNMSVAANSINTYTITNYNDFASHTLSAVSGAVSRSGATITYTAPATLGASGFVINGRTIAISVVTPVPAQAVITSPVNGATGVIESPTITTSAFSMLAGSDTHVSTDWQIATDVNFTNVVVQSINNTVNKVSWTPTLPTPNIAYYIRARHKGTTTGYGAYSPTVSVTAKTSFALYTEEAIKYSDVPTGSANFGGSLALNSDGTRLVIGESFYVNGSYIDSGRFYIFFKSGSSWIIETVINGTQAVGYRYFGYSVDIDSTGTRVVVGAHGSQSGLSAGEVHIFTRTGTSWNIEKSLTFSISQVNDHIGTSVCISDDGNTVAVGAPYADPSQANAGRIFVFTRSGTSWTEQALLTSDIVADSGRFGEAVDISGDGNRIITSSVNSNSIYIFSKSGTVWSLEQKITPPVGVTFSQLERSGWRYFSINTTGDRFILGFGFSTGVAYVYSRTGTVWTQEAQLIASDIQSSDGFGSSVSISGDGSVAVIGSYENDPSGFNNGGAVYTFTRIGTTWTQRTKLTASNKAAGDYLGNSVAISSNGNRIAAGAPWSSSSGVSFSGKVCIYS